MSTGSTDGSTTTGSTTDCTGSIIAVVILGIYAGIITILLGAAIFYFYKSRKKTKHVVGEGGNQKVTSLEEGRINQRFELTNDSANIPENRTQRNLKHDLEAQKRNRENALPINEVNIASNTPNFSRNQTEVIERNSPSSVNVQAWNIPASTTQHSVNIQRKDEVMPETDGPESTRTYIELTQGPNGDFQSIHSSTSSGSDNTVYNDVVEGTPKKKNMGKGLEVNESSLNKRRLISEASIKSTDFFDVKEYKEGSTIPSGPSYQDPAIIQVHLQKENQQKHSAPISANSLNKSKVSSSKRSRSSSSSSSTTSKESERSIYDDVTNLRKFDNIDLVQDSYKRSDSSNPKKKAAPPPPVSKSNTYVVLPNIDGSTNAINTKKEPNEDVFHDDGIHKKPMNVLKSNKNKSSSSSSSSSESSPELRKKKQSIEKDRQDVRTSFQAAPESYRKESSYIEAKSSNDFELRINELKKHGSRDAVSISSNSSIEAAPITPGAVTSSDFRQHIEGILDDSSLTGRNGVEERRDKVQQNIKFLPGKSSFSSSSSEQEEDIGKDESNGHGMVDIIDDQTIESFDDGKELFDQRRSTPNTQMPDSNNVLPSNYSSDSSTSSEDSVEQQNSTGQIAIADSNHKPPIPQKPEHLFNWKGRAKLNTSFNTNGMEVNVYRMENEESSIPVNNENVFPRQNLESVTNQSTKNKNYDPETDSEVENENLRKELQRTSSSSSLSSDSSSSASNVSASSKHKDKVVGLIGFSGSFDKETKKAAYDPLKSTSFRRDSEEKFTLWKSENQTDKDSRNRPPLQVQGNMDQDNMIPNENVTLKKCVPLNDSSCASSESGSTTEESENDDFSIPIAETNYNTKSVESVILPNLVTIGRTTSFETKQKPTLKGKTTKQGDSVDSSSSSSTNSSSSSISTTKTDHPLHSSALPPTALTNESDVIKPLPLTKNSKSMDTALLKGPSKVEDMFLRNLNHNYNSVYNSRNGNDPITQTDKSNASQPHLKAQITI